jgi:hypothetical protein
MPESRVLTSSELANELGVTVPTIKRAVDRGLIVPSFRTTSGRMRFDRHYAQELKRRVGCCPRRRNSLRAERSDILRASGARAERLRLRSANSVEAPASSVSRPWRCAANRKAVQRLSTEHSPRGWGVGLNASCATAAAARPPSWWGRRLRYDPVQPVGAVSALSALSAFVGVR